MGKLDGLLMVGAVGLGLLMFMGGNRGPSMSFNPNRITLTGSQSATTGSINPENVQLNISGFTPNEEIEFTVTTSTPPEGNPVYNYPIPITDVTLRATLEAAGITTDPNAQPIGIPPRVDANGGLNQSFPSVGVMMVLAMMINPATPNPIPVGTSFNIDITLQVRGKTSGRVASSSGTITIESRA